MRGLTTATQSLLALVVIFTGTNANFDMTTTDDCTVRMQGCLDRLDQAFGGAETVQQYDMGALIGQKENFFGISQVLFPEEPPASLSGRKRRAAGTIHHPYMAESLKRVRRQDLPPGGNVPPGPLGPGGLPPDLPPIEDIMMFEISSMWFQGFLVQSKTCTYLKIMDSVAVAEGQKCMRDIAEEEQCAPKFGLLAPVLEGIPPPSMYDIIQENLCSEGCQSMKEKHEVIGACPIYQSNGAVIADHIPKLLLAIEAGTETGVFCRNITEEALCMQRAAECCEYMLKGLRAEYMGSLPPPITELCTIDYEPDCQKAEVKKQALKPTSPGVIHQASVLVFTICVLFAFVM